MEYTWSLFLYLQDLQEKEKGNDGLFIPNVEMMLYLL